MSLTPGSLDELTWWIENLETSKGTIARRKPDLIIHTDASGQGWGAFGGRDKIG